MKSVLENRIKAFVVDYFIMAFIGLLILSFTNDLILTCLIIYPLGMNKDFLNGKSIGKRIFNIQVQNLENNISNEWRGALRNLLFIIPIDIFIPFINPKRRIGDYLARTKIEMNSEFNLSTIISELKNYRVNKYLIFGLAFGIINIYSLLWIYGLIFKTIVIF